jgi:predicted transposase YdaD
MSIRYKEGEEGEEGRNEGRKEGRQKGWCKLRINTPAAAAVALQ